MTGAGTTERDEPVASPLAGHRVLVTRARAQAGSTLAALAARGAEAVLLPLIEIVPPADPAPLRAALARVAEYDWVVVTSANAARAVAAGLADLGRAPGALGPARVCAVGPATAAALAGAGLRVDLVPAEHVGEGVVAALAAAGPLTGLRVLLPRAEEAREVVPEELRRRGAQVDVVVAYRNVRPAAAETEAVLDRLRRGEISVVTFASASAVHGFVAACGGDAAAAAAVAGAVVAVIGPKTRDAARDHGLPVAVMPSEYTIPALIDAIVAHLQGG
jgi:uroporphyrinogen III methyltransferase/synthase